jgi:hypothetical protein
MAMAEASQETERSRFRVMDATYRGYRLQAIATRQGWGVLVGDPAGQPAAVCLHQQLGHGGWTRLDEADRAAHAYVDALLAGDDSY